MKPYLQVTNDRAQEFKAHIDSFKYGAVLVGVPESTADRDPAKGNGNTEINNATILAINELGSPANNIPARHPLQTGIRINKDAIAEEYRKVAITAISKGIPALAPFYERIGTIAASGAKRAINEQIDMDEPADSTLVNRKRKGFNGLKGGFKGEKALLVTGQLRNAITYVVTGKL